MSFAQTVFNQGGVDGDPQASDIHACKAHRSADVSGREIGLASVAWHVEMMGSFVVAVFNCRMLMMDDTVCVSMSR